MEYKRQGIKAGAFKDIMPPGAVLSMLPELPTIEVKIEQYRCKIPDLRMLHDDIVSVFEQCVISAATNSELTGASFIVDKKADSRIDRIVDGLSAMKISGKKRGESFNMGFLVSGATFETSQNGDGIVTLRFIEDNANAIYEYYANRQQTGEIDYYDIATAIVRRFVSEDRKKMLEAIADAEPN